MTAISPIDIATHGTLNSPLSVAAVRGKLHIDDDAATGGGGAGGPRLLLPYAKLQRQLQREDDEILAIIIAAMEVMDE